MASAISTAFTVRVQISDWALTTRCGIVLDLEHSKATWPVGFGSTKNGMIQDFNLKYGLLQQTRNGKIPVSVTYFTDMAIETEDKEEELPNGRSSDRLSYFHQIIVSRKFNDKLSVQVAPSLSHYNVVEPAYAK